MNHVPLEPAIDRLGRLLVDTGRCDARSLERARRAAEESDSRFDVILLRLGLGAERGLADSYAELLDLPVLGDHEHRARRQRR